MNKVKNKKGVCMIIGGNGIVGKSICEAMINDWKVISISRTKSNIKEKNWKEYSCDVTNEKDFESIVNRIEKLCRNQEFVDGISLNIRRDNFQDLNIDLLTNSKYKYYSNIFRSCQIQRLLCHPFLI